MWIGRGTRAIVLARTRSPFHSKKDDKRNDWMKKKEWPVVKYTAHEAQKAKPVHTVGVQTNRLYLLLNFTSLYLHQSRSVCCIEHTWNWTSSVFLCILFKHFKSILLRFYFIYFFKFHCSYNIVVRVLFDEFLWRIQLKNINAVCSVQHTRYGIIVKLYLSSNIELCLVHLSHTKQ